MRRRRWRSWCTSWGASRSRQLLGRSPAVAGSVLAPGPGPPESPLACNACQRSGPPGPGASTEPATAGSSPKPRSCHVGAPLFSMGAPPIMVGRPHLSMGAPPRSMGASPLAECAPHLSMAPHPISMGTPLRSTASPLIAVGAPIFRWESLCHRPQHRKHRWADLFSRWDSLPRRSEFRPPRWHHRDFRWAVIPRIFDDFPPKPQRFPPISRAMTSAGSSRPRPPS
jgi:hypothetical protein